MLEIKKTVLMVIDAQGRLARVVSQSELACRQVVRMVTAADLLSIPVLLTAQAPEKIGHTIPEIAALLAGQLEYPRVTFSAMGAPALVSALEELARTRCCCVVLRPTFASTRPPLTCWMLVTNPGCSRTPPPPATRRTRKPRCWKCPAVACI